MALKAVHVSDVPNLDQVQENAALSLCSTRFTNICVNDHESGDHDVAFKFPKFVVMGHRGSGMNMLQSSDRRMKSIRENSILSFNSAAKLPLDFIEFDVQVTRDGYPVIFHDNLILTEDKGTIIEKRVTDLTLAEFLSYGPQKEAGNVGKTLFRKTKDGKIFEWKVEEDDPLCTLQEVFQKVDGTIGFNIELKFDDHIIYKQEEFEHILQAILKVVLEHAKDRPIMFSSFLPDAAQMMRKLQKKYPVFFLTNGGSEIYMDVRRNSLDEAIKVCMEGGLQGIVSEVKAIFRNPEAVKRIKESKLSIISYGQLNNVPEVVYVQHLMGIEGVIVDLVREITEAVSDFNNPAKAGVESRLFGKEGKLQLETLISAEFSADNLHLSTDFVVLHS
ncbi:glycerophosphodiester phosphodiesterase GDPD1, chloroplastic isoform X2 [Ricinus communis]|uniref:glycerophosphodiester phosphodiesterase n=1 Tax=Ricinus communis TaxID=3988 RepID=B9RM92_RICCO|nr:glycerophosphodiester phosphodiesterase GDPD1, chloroplastic isoform X2 [Ricinus communis]EEF47415.1 glycerophosphodiester phosphodiesterase, putative [Ricinus communis]